MASVKCKVNPCAGVTVKSNRESTLVETGNRAVTVLNTGWKRHSRGSEATFHSYAVKFEAWLCHSAAL